MTDLQPKPLDAAALPLRDRHLIEASAGTGKTFNITRIYLRLLLERELPVERILVMTFTRAATAELKGRLGREMQTAHDQWGSFQDPFYRQLQETVPAERARALLQQALLWLDEAAIYTIHGFCRRALTQQAFASRISFRADLESDTSELLTEALQDWYRIQARLSSFRELYAYYPTPEHFAAAWGREVTGGDGIPEPEPVDPAPAWEAFRRAWPEESAAFHRTHVGNRRKPEIRADWEARFEELQALSQQPWPGEVPEIFDGPFINTVLDEKKKDATPVLAELAVTLQGLDRYRRAWWAWQGITYARGHLASSKDRLDQLDFNDLIRILRERLQDTAAGDALAGKLLEQFPAALVDEFQDTDPDQYAILRAIYQRQGAGDAFLCMIGDPKQAIYGFRGGDVFAYLKARADASHYWVMDTNYRSAAEVIQGYNRLFHGRPLDDVDGGDVFGFGIRYAPVAVGRPNLPGLNDPAGRSGFQWCLLGAEPDGNGKVTPFNKAAQHRLADWSAREIGRLLAEAQVREHEDAAERPVRPGDVAILVRDRHEAEVMQQALRAHGLNAVYLSARDNVLASPEAETLYTALGGILDLEDDRALVAALATPWFGYDTLALHRLQQDEHAWARALDAVHDLRHRWQQQGFMSMALRLLQRHAHPDPDRHERLLTNSIHLLELLQEAGQQHRQPRALLHWFRQAREEAGNGSGGEAAQLRLENDANLVQVITLHGAKGLEYPVVFLPFVSFGKSPRGEPLLVRYHDRSDFSVRQVLNPDQREQAWYLEEQAAEEIRLLYVGATRGERRVYLGAAEFRSFTDSPLARCTGADSFGALAAKVEQHREEGAAGVLDIATDVPDAGGVPAGDSPTPPRAATFTGRIERDWWLSSFSALTRNVRHGGLATPDRDHDDDIGEAVAAEGPSLRFTLERGAEAGNLLHDILEWLDFQAPDFDAALNRAADRHPALTAPREQRLPALRRWLEEVIATPLPGGATLGHLPWTETLRESAFYFPMNGGRARGRLGQILARHRGRDDLVLPEPATLKGMLHGYIDLVYHWQGRYYVVDYKSTYLGRRFEDYCDPQLTENVQHSYYDLQYLLYGLALHRYLRARLTDYDPQRHLGGVQYLYLRGMAPEAPGGVYHRPADVLAIQALDRLFAGEEATA
ncbi:UvrD-helicase domain-containing protein [Aquisalimonas sp. 2447]|uniref:UvrD-helicase domain-containing protein n=1 Tax=Aquisalimonas sp. 2447 TaxID=2740807 RepID=UPI0014324AA7|nr:UvrD-helicase domain-containing protein [Aquisalimonas sp. 2447]QIT55052.1 UvrD-helicase domain-containing protein [Aquisalimonas sp. 2447]